MTPAEAAAWLDDRIANAEAKGYDEDRPCATFVASTSRGLPIRPKKVDWKPGGGGIYMITLKQARKWRATL